MKRTITVIASVLLLVACKKEKKSETTPDSSTPPVVTPACDSTVSMSLLFSSNFEDASCNNNDGINMGASLANDRNNSASKALSFNGTTSYVELLNDTLLHPTFPFTVSFWVNPADSASLNNQFIQAQNNPVYYGYWIQANTGTGQIVANFGNGTSSNVNGRHSVVSSVKLRSNTWTHVTVKYIGVNNVQIYFNGVIDNLGTYSGLATSIVYLPTANTIAKGRIGSALFSASTYFNGKLDNVKIWKRALTNAEISAEYSSTN